MYVEIVLVVVEYDPVKIESIPDPSIFVTVQVKVPHWADVKPLLLVASESAQL